MTVKNLVYMFLQIPFLVLEHLYMISLHVA